MNKYTNTLEIIKIYVYLIIKQSLPVIWFVVAVLLKIGLPVVVRKKGVRNGVEFEIPNALASKLW